MRKLNVLLVTGIFPPDHGGPASYVPAIARALIDKGHRIVGIVTLSDKLAHEDTVYDFPLIRITRSQNSILRKIKTIFEISRYARQADVVYLNGLVLEGILACKILTGRSVVVRVVGDLIWEKVQNSGKTEIGVADFQRRSLGIRIDALKKLQAWYTKMADKVITPSKYLGDIVLEWGVSPKRLHVIYNSVEPLNTNYANNNIAFDVVCVGRLIKLKCLDAVVRVCVRNNWKCLVVGDGPFRSNLDKLILDSDASKLITLYGHARREDVPRLMGSAKIFVLNSVHETFPHVLLEAKQTGVPVVATRVGGIPEMIDHNIDGILIPPNDDVALENAIGGLLADEKMRQALSFAAKSAFEEKFSWSALVSKTECVLALAAGIQESQDYGNQK